MIINAWCSDLMKTGLILAYTDENNLNVMMEHFVMNTRDEGSTECMLAKTCANAASKDGIVVIASSLLL
jgi:hypothetical protein